MSSPSAPAVVEVVVNSDQLLVKDKAYGTAAQILGVSPDTFVTVSSHNQPHSEGENEDVNAGVKNPSGAIGMSSTRIDEHIDQWLPWTQVLHTTTFKKFVFTAASALKPVDWVMFTWMAVTTPWLFVRAPSAADVVWLGVILRVIFVPFVLYFRFFFATVHPSTFTTYTLFRLPRGRVLTLTPAQVAGFGLDIYATILCFIFYSEDGAVIQNLYPNPAVSFWDDHFKQVDVDITGVSILVGVGYEFRALSGIDSLANHFIGEYLSFCYFMFYFILGGTVLFGYIFAPRHSFDGIVLGQTMTYAVCLFLFVIFPAAGPFWSYPDMRPEPGEIGWVFPYIVQYLVKGGSAHGTAFPSAHCGVTVATMVVTLIYFRPLGIIYLFIGPGLIVATVWLGFHYVIDALCGASIGLVLSLFAVLIHEKVRYTHPLTGDDKFPMLGFPKREGAGGDEEQTTAQSTTLLDTVDMESETPATA